MKKTLLLADDSPTIQKVINLTFADEGIDVISVGDGNAAIQQLRDIKPDLVMADVHMPGLNGYQICERIRQNAELSKVPVILLVGSFEPFDEDEAIRVGADDFLMKPFQSIRQLVSRVAALLETPAEAAVEPEVIEAEAAKTEVVETVAVENEFVEPIETEESVADVEQVAETAEVLEAHLEIETEHAVAFEEETHTTTSGAYSSITPQDVFRSPWTDAPKVEESARVDEPAVVENIAPVVEAPVTEGPVTELAVEITGEVDELADFDAEFDQKFPDAATLSSPTISTPEPEPLSFQKDIADRIETENLSYSPAPEIAETVDEFEVETPALEETVEEVSEAANNVTEYPFAGQMEEPVAIEESKELEEYVSESAESELPQYLESPVAEELLDQEVPERILDDGGAAPAVLEQVSTETAYDAPYEIVGEEEELPEVLDARVIDDPAELTQLEEEQVEEAPTVFERVSEDETVDESPAEDPSITQFSGVANYDFRSPDAFDEDADIEEQFRGIRFSAIEVQPQIQTEPEPEPAPEAEPVSFVPEPEPEQEPEIEDAAAEPVAVAEFERVIDAEPSEISVDQADGFSETAPVAEAPRVVTAEDIEAIAQRVSEKLLEKLVRNLAPDMKDLIIEEISGEAKKDQ